MMPVDRGLFDCLRDLTGFRVVDAELPFDMRGLPGFSPVFFRPKRFKKLTIVAVVRDFDVCKDC